MRARESLLTEPSLEWWSLKEKESFPLKPRTNISETRGGKRKSYFWHWRSKGEGLSEHFQGLGRHETLRVNITTNHQKKHLFGWQQSDTTGSAAKNSCSVSVLELRLYTVLIVEQESRLTVSDSDITLVICSLFHRFTSASTIKRHFVHLAFPDGVFYKN